MLGCTRLLYLCRRVNFIHDDRIVCILRARQFLLEIGHVLDMVVSNHDSLSICKEDSLHHLRFGL